MEHAALWSQAVADQARGYAFQVGAYIHNGQNRKVISLAEPLVAAIFEMIAKCADKHKAKELLIPYAYPSNRPFHRLVHGQVLAKRMFLLWPNDNMGFRFIIADLYGND